MAEVTANLCTGPSSPFCHTGIVPEGLPACGVHRQNQSVHAQPSLARYLAFAVGVYDDYPQYLLHQIKY